MRHFTLYFQIGAVVKTWKKSSRSCRIFGFVSSSRQFVFNAL